MARSTDKKKIKPQKSSVGFHFNNIEKKNKNFMYQNLTKSNCYNSDFSNSNFDYVSFRGAHFKSCNFFGCSFKESEFIGANLKGSRFNNATFENAIFESAKLIDVDFKGAKFINTIFLYTDLEGVKHLNLEDSGLRILNEMPEFEISDALKETVEHLMQNKFVKKSRVLDTREGKINYLSLMILLEQFDEALLIKGLNKVEAFTDRDFFSLSYIIKLIHKLQKDGLLE
ncbi:MAG: pentapeptide repeat-containing protein [Clostridiales bacterium]|nr:pentapeptide repeat-containing protein [Clostridiales bacterium]